MPVLAAATVLAAAGSVIRPPAAAAPESDWPGEVEQSAGTETIVLEAVADTWVGFSWEHMYGTVDPPPPAPPRGGDSRIVVGNHDEHRGMSYAFVRFEAPELPPGSYLRDATLEMYAERSYNGPRPGPVPSACIGMAIRPWEESTLASDYGWPFPDYDLHRPYTCTRPAVGQWSEWNVSTIVRHQIAIGANHGLLIGAGPITTRFSSRESGRPPRLVLTADLRPPSDTLYVPLSGRGEGGASPDPLPLTAPPTPQSRSPHLPWLELEARSERLTFGERPWIDTQWANRSEASVTVIRPVDGSKEGWRMPMYLWEVERTDDKPVRQRRLGRCGNYNALREEDFLELAPGDSIVIGGAKRYGWLDASPVSLSFVDPGTYRARLLYALDREGGVHPEGVENLWADAAEMSVVSQPVTVTVEGPTGRYADRLDASRAIAPGTPLGDVGGALGAPDQRIDGEYTVHSHFWVYYLADPRDGEPKLLQDAHRDNLSDAYWRPRFVVAFDDADRVAEAILLP